MSACQDDKANRVPDHLGQNLAAFAQESDAKVSGTIREWGSNYFADSPLAQYWEEAVPFLGVEDLSDLPEYKPVRCRF